MVGVYVFEGVGMLFFVLGVIFVMVGKAKFKCTAETEEELLICALMPMIIITAVQDIQQSASIWAALNRECIVLFLLTV